VGGKRIKSTSHFVKKEKQSQKLRAESVCCRAREEDSLFWKSVIQRALRVCVRLLTDCITSTYPPLSSRLQFDPKQQGIMVTLPYVSRKVSISKESKVLQQRSRECRTDI